MGSRRGVREVYGKGAGAYDRRWAAYLRTTVEATVAALPPAAGATVLDVGCGTGVLLESLLAREPSVRAVGVDLTPEMLEVARLRLGRRASLVLADAVSLPFEAGTFGMAATSSVLHHWSEPDATLAEIARVLEPGGVLVLTDWRGDHLPTRIRDLALRVRDPSHRRAYDVRTAQRMLGRASYRIRSVRRHRLGWSWGFMTIVAQAAR